MEFLQIVHLGFDNSPKAFHRSIINASANTGHTLDSTNAIKLIFELFIGTLKASVAMKKWLCIGDLWLLLGQKGFKDKLVVIGMPKNIGDNTSVAQI